MKKKQKTKQKTGTGAKERNAKTSVGWAALYAPFRQAFEDALDSAAQIVFDHPQDLAAVERVRDFMRQQGAGRDADLRVEDALFTFGLVVVLGEIARYVDRVNSRGPWPAVPLDLPSAAERWDRTITRHLDSAQQLGSPLRFASA